MSGDAERWVTISAALVAGIYAYRRVTEGATAPGSSTVRSVIGQGTPPPLGTFVTAWGFVYVVVSIMATANPDLGKAFALLIAAADFLANAPAIFSDVGKHTATTPGTGTGAGPGNFVGQSNVPLIIPTSHLGGFPPQAHLSPTSP